MEFIDIDGASGRSYRFRLWRDHESHPPTAGNYVVLERDAPSSSSPLLIGVTNDLARAGARVRDRAQGSLFTRLNVARAAREAEHDDIVAKHPSAQVVHIDP